MKTSSIFFYITLLIIAFAYGENISPEITVIATQHIEEIFAALLTGISAIILASLTASKGGNTQKLENPTEGSPHTYHLEGKELVDKSTYIKLVNRHNEFVSNMATLKAPLECRGVAAEGVIKIALIFSLANMLLTLSIDYKSIPYIYSLSLIVTGFIMTFTYISFCKLEVNDDLMKLFAFQIGGYGLLLGGFIVVTTALPFNIDTLINKSSPIPGLQMLHYIIFLRVVIIPLAGILGAFLGLRLLKAKRISSGTSNNTVNAGI